MSDNGLLQGQDHVIVQEFLSDHELVMGLVEGLLDPGGRLQLGSGVSDPFLVQMDPIFLIW